MKISPLNALVVSTLFLAACGDKDGTEPVDTDSETEEPNVDAPDTESPWLVSISPQNGAVGIWADTDIVLSFSEAMNTESVENGIESLGIGPMGCSWNSEGDEVTCTPDEPLAYASGRGNNPNIVAANSYKVSIGEGMMDLAGNALVGGGESIFSTLREMHTGFERTNDLTGTGTPEKKVSDADDFIAVGDDTYNIAYRSYFTFNLWDVPDTAVAVVEATLSTVVLSEEYGKPYADLGNVMVESISYQDINNAAFNASPYGSAQVFSKHGDVDILVDVTDMVDADLAERDARNHRSQFRIQTEDFTDLDNLGDGVFYSRDDLYLDLVFLAP